jgi:hypothetical protein
MLLIDEFHHLDHGVVPPIESADEYVVYRLVIDNEAPAYHDML